MKIDEYRRKRERATTAEPFGEDAFASSERDLLAEAPRSVLSGLTVEELEEAPRIAEVLEARAPARPRSRRRSARARRLVTADA